MLPAVGVGTGLGVMPKIGRSVAYSGAAPGGVGSGWTTYPTIGSTDGTGEGDAGVMLGCPGRSGPIV